MIFTNKFRLLLCSFLRYPIFPIVVNSFIKILALFVILILLLSIFYFKRIFQNFINQTVNLDLNIIRLYPPISILKNVFNHLLKIILLTTSNIEEKIEILKHLSWWDYRILLILNQHIFTIIRIFFNDLSWLIFNLIL